MSCHYILEKNKNFMNDYSCKEKRKYDFSLSGSCLVRRDKFFILKKINNLENYADLKEEEELREKIRKKYNLYTDEIIFGAGINGIIQNLINLFFNDADGNLVSPFYTFHQATYGCVVKGASVRLVKMKKDGGIDFEGLRKSIDDTTKMIFICNPNNPTGIIEKSESIIKFAESVKVPVIVSEASIAFSEEKSLFSFDKIPNNLIVLKSLSKEYALAGIRLGFARVSKHFKDNYLQNTSTHQVSSISILIANKYFDNKYVEKNIMRLKKERAFLSKELNRLGIETFDSSSNTLLTKRAFSRMILEKIEENNCSLTTVKNEKGDDLVRIAIRKRKLNLWLIKLLEKLKGEYNENFFSD